MLQRAYLEVTKRIAAEEGKCVAPKIATITKEMYETDRVFWEGFGATGDAEAFVADANVDELAGKFADAKARLVADDILLGDVSTILTALDKSDISVALTVSSVSGRVIQEVSGGRGK